MWKKFTSAFREVWIGCKIGLVLGCVIGLSLAVIFDVKPRKSFEMVILMYGQRGLFVGAFVGGVVRLVKIWRARGEKL